MAHAIAIDNKKRCSKLLVEGSKTFGSVRYNGKKYIKVSNQTMADAIDSLVIDCKTYTPGKFPLRNLKSVTFARDDVLLGSHSFYESGLEHVDLTKLTHLTDAAFTASTALKSISLPKTIKEIPDYLFTDCMNLTSVKVNSDIIELGPSCFENCHHLDFKIPETVTRIRENAMHGTANHEVIIPEFCTHVEDMAFAFMNNLKRIVIKNPNTEIHRDAFYGCDKVESVQIGNKTYPANYENDNPVILMTTEQVDGIDVGMTCFVGDYGEPINYFYYAHANGLYEFGCNSDTAIKRLRSKTMLKYHKKHREKLPDMPADYRMDISLQEMYCVMNDDPNVYKYSIYSVPYGQYKNLLQPYSCDRCRAIQPEIFRECTERYFGRKK